MMTITLIAFNRHFIFVLCSILFLIKHCPCILCTNSNM
ncbi:hypothetical protein BN1221_01938 [Brenneria goodwinii]|uniref:Uncharacterized protein n=1 Tax=Brenneria goodwinii TaxID=1109412 RepID=A0A0G4JU81_9GAMM|nr:hypothetical protein BN1221_01938 [Brenneria goodwinii]